MSASPRLRVMQLTRASRRLILSVRITAGKSLDSRGGDPGGGRVGFIPDDLAVEDEGALGLVHLFQRLGHLEPRRRNPLLARRGFATRRTGWLVLPVVGELDEGPSTEWRLPG